MKKMKKLLVVLLLLSMLTSMFSFGVAFADGAGQDNLGDGIQETNQPGAGGSHEDEVKAPNGSKEADDAAKTDQAVYVASVDGVSYESLSAAVSAVAEGGTVTLLTGCDEAVTADKSFVISNGDNNVCYTGAISVTAGTVRFSGVGCFAGKYSVSGDGAVAFDEGANAADNDAPKGDAPSLENAVAILRGEGFTSVAAAVAAAKEGDIVTLAKDVYAREEIKTGANITIDAAKHGFAAFISCGGGNVITVKNIRPGKDDVKPLLGLGKYILDEKVSANDILVDRETLFSVKEGNVHHVLKMESSFGAFNGSGEISSEAIKKFAESDNVRNELSALVEIILKQDLEKEENRLFPDGIDGLEAKIDLGVYFAKSEDSNEDMLVYDLAPTASITLGETLVLSDYRISAEGDAILVTLPVETREPKSIKHIFSDGSGEEYFAHGNCANPGEFTFEPTTASVTLYVTKFSRFEILCIDPPAIMSEVLPEGSAWEEYSAEIKVDGKVEEIIVTDELPAGLTAYGGTISGTPTTVGKFKIGVMAYNAAGYVAQEVELDIGGAVAEVGGVGFATFGEAVAAAGDGGTVTIVSDIASDIVIDRSVLVKGEGRTVGNVSIADGVSVNIDNLKAGTITVGSGAAAGISSCTADKLVCKPVSNTLLSGSSNIKAVSSEDGNVRITGGNYGTLSGSGYSVSGGTYGMELPFNWCRVYDGDGNLVTQYVTKYNEGKKAYVLQEFRIDIVGVTNRAYHSTDSYRDIGFTLSVPYGYAEPETVYIIEKGSKKKVPPLRPETYSFSESDEGLTVVTLKYDFLNSLDLGKYAFYYADNVGYKDANNNYTGYAARYFTITDTYTAVTGDSSNIGLWIGVLGVAALGMIGVVAVVVVNKKKNKKSGD